MLIQVNSAITNVIPAMAVHEIDSCNQILLNIYASTKVTNVKA